ncbi:transposase, partial [Flavobacterium sp. XN-5]|uniref:transposase n=1 Tax=Flavobacterium sp. XN-5 TaxID=2599390 RepID=UPI0011C7EE6D
MIQCFSRAIQVTDRFHVQKLALEAMQEIRVKHRWEAMDIENQLIMQAKRENRTYIPDSKLESDLKQKSL